MKKVNLIVMFSVTVLILAGISMLDYNGKTGWGITGKYVGPRIDCLNPCSDGTLPGECSYNQPFYCLDGAETAEECGLIEDCQTCGCLPNLECKEDGSCGLPSDDPPEITHTGCVEVTEGAYVCMDLPGVGYDECGSDDDCYTVSHTECSGDGRDGYYCQSVFGPGKDQCDAEGCLPEYLNRCDDYTWDNECQIANQPIYCEDGSFVNDCQTCSCPIGLTCSDSGDCTYIQGGDDFEDLIYLSSISIELDKNSYLKSLMDKKLTTALKFDKQEIPIMRFIRPTITRMSLELPEKPEIKKFEGDSINGEIEKSPPQELEKAIVIQGLRKPLDGLQLSPGLKRPKEFEMILGIRGSIPYIGLSFPDIP
jgi:hypothetical protein